MKNLIIILICLLLTSCMTVKRIEKNCDLFEKICLTDSKDTVFITKETETTYRDTVVDYQIKRDTIFKETPIIFFKKEMINSPISHLEVGLAKSDAWIESNILKHFLQSGDTILQIKLNDALRNIKVLHTRLEKKQSIITIKENTKFAGFAIKWFMGSLIIIALGLTILILKFSKWLVF